jgi:3-deoxy-D-manno-octulosonic-acid transferase
LYLPSAPATKDAIWIHALSVGEVISALPLVRALKQQYPHQALAFTVTTRQGMQVALKELEKEVDLIEYMPLDFWWAIRRVTAHIQPVVFILVETDLWPGLVHYLKKNRIKTMLLNGRISPRTYKAYRRVRFLMRLIFNQFDLILMQTHLDCDRLLQIGAPATKVKNNGNIKFDRPWQNPDPAVIQSRKKQLGLASNARVWVAGSTHPDEESLILDAFIPLKQQFPALHLIIAPRRIERTAEILQLILSKKLKPALKTNLTPDSSPYDILLLDTIGELEGIYALADIAFVGGSLVPVGGHNLLEPASFAKPVLFGPYTHNFEIMAESLIAAGGGQRVQSGNELYLTLQKFLGDPAQLTAMGSSAQNFVKSNSGALARTIEQVSSLICI